MSRIGLIFECGPQGADKQVCEYLARRIRPDADFVPRTLDNKPKLLDGAAKVARELLGDGCERVLVIWDLRPAWPDKRHKPCRQAERATLLQALASENLSNAPVFLVCVEQELESWLLADERRLSAHLSTDAHRYSVQRVRAPDRVGNPKSVVMTHFKNARGWRYEDRVHAYQVVSQGGGSDLARLRRSASFARFEAKLC